MKNYVRLLCLYLFLAACQQQENVDLLNTANQLNEVQPEAATTIARNFNTIFAATSFTGKSKKPPLNDKEKTVKEITSFRDETGKAVYYVISYNEGGFVIVSAEKKTMPILAFSQTNIFPINKNLPDGVKQTMAGYKDAIKKARATASAPDPEIVKEWQRLENTDVVNQLVKKKWSSNTKTKSEPVDGPCENSQVYVELATAAWGQRAAWNTQMPQQHTFGCTSMPNGRALTGCVATAMAEVMNFHDYPNTYNWAAMGAYQSETARLMRDAANSVNMIYMCGGSGAYGSAIAPGLVNSFGYSPTASHGSYNLTTITNEILTWGRPVIIGGLQAANGGHAWVCDGLYQYFPCDSGGYAPMLFMNWGWEGIGNGFYSTSTDFVPSGQSTPFTNLDMIFSIRP
jgi:hypothetical protein